MTFSCRGYLTPGNRNSNPCYSATEVLSRLSGIAGFPASTASGAIGAFFWWTGERVISFKTRSITRILDNTYPDSGLLRNCQSRDRGCQKAPRQACLKARNGSGFSGTASSFDNRDNIFCLSTINSGCQRPTMNWRGHAIHQASGNDYRQVVE